tara:strand:+ start:206 stop:481 length:276 start_codon:yes stop_codon:yes gene_type:complete
MSEICTATIKLTEHEIDKLIWCMKTIENVFGAFQINPEEEWSLSFEGILKDMERIANDIKEAKTNKSHDKKQANPKKEYIAKINGKESIEK